jgi:hypothetical protein
MIAIIHGYATVFIDIPRVGVTFTGYRIHGELLQLRLKITIKNYSNQAKKLIILRFYYGISE